MISYKKMIKIFAKRLGQWEKWLQERSSCTSSTHVFLCLFHTVLLIQFGFNLHFSKAEILVEAAHSISAFWKTNSCKLIPNWSWNRLITYTNNFISLFLGFCRLFTRINRKDCFHSWWVCFCCIVVLYWEYFCLACAPYFSGLL